MRYDYPIRGDFDVTVNINIDHKKVGTKSKVTMKYKQASIRETIEFLKTSQEGDLTKWMVDFLSENSDINKITLGLLKIDKGLSDKIFETIKDSRFRGVFGKTETKDSEKATQPYNAVLVYLCEKLSIDPERFQNEYTIEQMNYLIEGTIYNANSQTEEGQVENERTQFNKNNADEDLLDLIN